MSVPYTVDEMIQQVRDGLDEDNTTSVSSSRILRSLNRSQRRLVKIIARRAEFLLLATDVATTDGTNIIPVPTAAFNSRAESLSWNNAGAAWPIEKLNARRALALPGTGIPRRYTQKGNSLLLFPTPPAGGTISIDYVRRPESLVISQGRIIAVDVEAGTLTLDALGSGITTSVSNLTAFFNVIDGVTGEVKGSYQASSATNDVITIKPASLDRTTVYGRTINTALADTIAPDDFICVIGGTCVPEVIADFGDFMVAGSVLEIKRSLGEDVAGEAAQFKDEVEELNRSWVGREKSSTILKRSGAWRAGYSHTRRSPT